MTNEQQLRQALLICVEAIEQPEIKDPRASIGTWTPTPAYQALRNAARDARKVLEALKN